MRKFDEAKLQSVYEFIVECQNEERRSPTYREIANACSINSTAWVSKLVNVLEERGLIELTQKDNKRSIHTPRKLTAGKSKTATIVGSCPCGEPILATENIVATVALPVEIFGNEEHFILKAVGHSMVKRGIFDGDLMVVRMQNVAELGEVVIARVNQDEATAKVLQKKNGRYYLAPANDATDENGKRIYKNIYPKGEWEILGVVDHVIHRPTKEV